MTAKQFILKYTLIQLYNFKLVTDCTYSNGKYTIKLKNEQCYILLNGGKIKLNSISEYKKYIRTDKLNKLLNEI
jgi:hypothetical protein